MKKLLIPALALAATAVALPAAAQSYGPGHQRGPSYERVDRNWVPISQRARNLEHRIDQGVRNRQLSRREAQALRRDLDGLVRLEAQYRRNGLTAWERRDLDRRYDNLSARVRYERHDRNGRRR